VTVSILGSLKTSHSITYFSSCSQHHQLYVHISNSSKVGETLLANSKSNESLNSLTAMWYCHECDVNETRKSLRLDSLPWMIHLVKSRQAHLYNHIAHYLISSHIQSSDSLFTALMFSCSQLVNRTFLLTVSLMLYPIRVLPTRVK
jgi:hypothetical protein